MQSVFDWKPTLNPQIPRLTPTWDAFGFISNFVTKFSKADPGKMQLSSRIAQIWLPVDSESTDHNRDGRITNFAL